MLSILSTIASRHYLLRCTVDIGPLYTSDKATAIELNHFTDVVKSFKIILVLNSYFEYLETVNTTKRQWDIVASVS